MVTNCRPYHRKTAAIHFTCEGFQFTRPTRKKRFQKTNPKKHMRTHDVQNLFTNFHLKIDENESLEGSDEEEKKKKFEL